MWFLIPLALVLAACDCGGGSSPDAGRPRPTPTPDGGDTPDGSTDGGTDGSTPIQGPFSCQTPADCPANNGLNTLGYHCDLSQDPGLCVPLCETDADCPDVTDAEGKTIDLYCAEDRDPKVCLQQVISGGN